MADWPASPIGQRRGLGEAGEAQSLPERADVAVVGGGLIGISMLSGFLSMGILKKSQPADLLR